MKKKSFATKLYLKKHTIASLEMYALIGGTVATDDPTTVDNSLGKQSTCPIETCTCLEELPVPTKL